MKSNLFVVGAMKGGTTWVVNQLGIMDEVFVPYLKEPHYFSQLKSYRKHIRHISDYQNYLNLYKSSIDEKYLVDGSVSYLTTPNVANKIFKHNPDSKIIILLRDPVQRAFSHYLMMLREGNTVDQDFIKELENDYHNELNNILESKRYIKNGLYYSGVREYLDLFGSENVLIEYYPEVLERPMQVLKRICSFLQLEFEEAQYSCNKVNQYARPRNVLTKKILGSDYLRLFLQFFIPIALRKTIKNKFLIMEDTKPVLQRDDYECLYMKYFFKDVQLLEKRLGCKFPLQKPKVNNILINT
ncbi:MAG: sulfotransferase [Candidatus Thiodiazotropha sp. 6PDIVS]